MTKKEVQILLTKIRILALPIAGSALVFAVLHLRNADEPVQGNKPVIQAQASPQSEALSDASSEKDVVTVPGDVYADVDSVIDQTTGREVNPHLLAQKGNFREVQKESLPELLRSISVENLTGIEGEQLDELYSVLERELWAYKSGDGALILDSRLRAPFQINDAIQDDLYHPRGLEHWSPPPDRGIPTDPQDIMRQSVLDWNNGTNGSGYKNSLNKLACDVSSIVLDTSEGMPMTIAELERFKPQTPGTGRAWLTPHLFYDESPEEVIRKNNRLFYADVMLATTDENDDRFARMKRYYYAPDLATWLPMESGRTFGVGSAFGTRYEFF
jgi:hypothetical protein